MSVHVKEEAELADEEVCLKEECEDSTDGYGVSEAAMLAGLYADHEVKDELVLGPECPHRPTVDLVVRASTLVTSVSGRGRPCSVRLERLLVDAARRTCRVGRRTYKLHATEPAPTTNVTTAIYQCHHCGKQFRNKSVLKKHLKQDMENYMQYKTIGSVKKIRMKPNTVPSKFSHNMPIVSPSHTAESTLTTVTGSSTSFHVKEEAELVDEEVCVKEECEDSTDGYGVSEAAMLAGLYADHEVKDELVLGPECPHRPTVDLVVRASALVSSVSGRGRPCSVRLERLLVDAARRTCRVGRRTYKLHTTEPAPTTNVTTAIYQCHHCGKQFRNKSVLKKHVLTHSPLHNSTRDYGSEHHIMLNNRKKPYKYCDNKNTSENPYKCNYCDYKCKQKSHLQSHEMTHTGEKPFKCNYCDYKCKRKRDLRTHEMTHTGENPFKCNYCDYKYKQKSDLRSHEMTHTGEKPFKCNYCDYKCKRKSHLRTHKMTHTSDKPFECNYCDYKCKQKSHLQNHKMTHTSEKPFKCNYCDYKCKRKAHLQSHEMTHTGEKPFECNYCDYKCNRKAQLRIHEMTHTGEKPFKCNYCDYKCKQKARLRTHEMTHADGSRAEAGDMALASETHCALNRTII
ncbi:zinc finger protein 845-like [Cydia amplana]|uniref:zinc finger protein 845-like n=1 Tax=Cydia amplana TaxID=1869771 RepID=UPI002FE6BFF7